MIKLVDWDSYVDTACFVSGLVWIPYTILLFFLFREHQARKRFPQNIIILLLAIGAIFRCVWFILFTAFDGTVLMEIINRLAILLQFSSISVLILMWLRALQITRTVYRSQPSESSGSSQFSVATQQSDTPIDSAQQQRPSLFQFPSTIERQHLYVTRVILAVNCLVWVSVLVSLAGNHGHGFYNLNILMISFLCCCEGIFTLIAGLRVALVLQKELAPVFVSPSNRRPSSHNRRMNMSNDDPTVLDRLCGAYHACLEPFYGLYRLFFSQSAAALSLQLQRDVLRSLLGVSLLVFLTSALRALGFLSSFLGTVGFSRGAQGADDLYPLFFYQVPELIPSLAIALAISPPNGLLRRWFNSLQYLSYRYLGCSLSSGSYDGYDGYGTKNNSVRSKNSLASTSDSFGNHSSSNHLEEGTDAATNEYEEEEDELRQSSSIFTRRPFSSTANYHDGSHSNNNSFAAHTHTTGITNNNPIHAHNNHRAGDSSNKASVPPELPGDGDDHLTMISAPSDLSLSAVSQSIVNDDSNRDSQQARDSHREDGNSSSSSSSSIQLPRPSITSSSSRSSTRLSFVPDHYQSHPTVAAGSLSHTGGSMPIPIPLAAAGNREEDDDLSRGHDLALNSSSKATSANTTSNSRKTPTSASSRSPFTGSSSHTNTINSRSAGTATGSANSSSLPNRAGRASRVGSSRLSRDEWQRQRQQSDEYAELLYRLNSCTYTTSPLLSADYHDRSNGLLLQQGGSGKGDSSSRSNGLLDQSTLGGSSSSSALPPPPLPEGSSSQNSGSYSHRSSWLSRLLG